MTVMYFIMGFTIIFMIICLFDRVYTSELAEYCSLDTFSPKCEIDEVVVIKEAFYGRIRQGRCIRSNFMLGCAVNVLNVADKICSGKRTCSISIPSSEMMDRLHCLQEQSLRGAANMEVSYLCKKVYEPRNKPCRSPEKIIVSKQTQYLASVTSTETSCGLHESPWILEAELGQQIQLNMIDFSWTNDTNDFNDQDCLINYGYILNMENDDVVHICGGGEREKQLYISSGHSVQIVLESGKIVSSSFLLGFKATGCPDYKPPNHSWIQKENSTLIIGCVSSDITWKLTCVDNRWLGMVGNCTAMSTTAIPSIEVIQNQPENNSEKSTVKLPNISNNHVIVFTMACLTILICCVIVIVGVYYIKRYDVKLKKYSKPNYSTTASYNSGGLTLTSVPVTYRTVLKNNGNETFKPPAYTFSLPKTQHAPKVPPRNTSTGYKEAALDEEVFSQRNVYENVNDDAESVQYYILENPAESGSTNT